MLMEQKKRSEKPLGGNFMGVMLDTIGQLIAGYLQKEVPGYEPFTPSDPEHLRGVIQPGDVLLVEGNNRISGIIKYLDAIDLVACRALCRRDRRRRRA